VDLGRGRRRGGEGWWGEIRSSLPLLKERYWCAKEKRGISVRAREAVVKVCLLAVYSDGLFSWWTREPLFSLINYFFLTFLTNF